jgi:hypothetical protein
MNGEVYPLGVRSKAAAVGTMGNTLEQIQEVWRDRAGKGERTAT